MSFFLHEINYRGEFQKKKERDTQRENYRVHGGEKDEGSPQTKVRLICQSLECI